MQVTTARSAVRERSSGEGASVRIPSGFWSEPHLELYIFSMLCQEKKNESNWTHSFAGFLGFFA